MDKLEKEAKRHLDYLKERHDYFFLSVQGSQNYEMETLESDVDTKAAIFPSFNDVILGKEMFSHTYVLDNNEHIDTKDLRLMFHQFKKQNTSYIELLFSKKIFVNNLYLNEFRELFYMREAIARYDMRQSVKAFYGMVLQKYKALKHPYPSLVDKIEKYGYDPKQLHHIFRLEEMLERFLNGEPYKKVLISRDKDFLKKVKSGFFSLDYAEKESLIAVNNIKAIVDRYLEKTEGQLPNKETGDFLDNLATELIKKFLRNELQKENKNDRI